MEYYVIGSAKVKEILEKNGFKEITNPLQGYRILSGKKCYQKGETYFYIDPDSMLVVRDMKYYNFRGKIVRANFFKNIVNSLPTKLWKDLL